MKVTLSVFNNRSCSE